MYILYFALVNETYYLEKTTLKFHSTIFTNENNYQFRFLDLSMTVPQYIGTTTSIPHKLQILNVMQRKLAVGIHKKK